MSIILVCTYTYYMHTARTFIPLHMHNCTFLYTLDVDFLAPRQMIGKGIVNFKPNSPLGKLSTPLLVPLYSDGIVEYAERFGVECAIEPDMEQMRTLNIAKRGRGATVVIIDRDGMALCVHSAFCVRVRVALMWYCCIGYRLIVHYSLLLVPAVLLLIQPIDFTCTYSIYCGVFIIFH